MSRLRFPYVSLFLPCALGVAFGPASAQEREAPTPEEVRAAESAPLFASHEILELILEADFHTMRQEDRKEEDSEEHPAGMKWRNADGSTGSQEIQLQTRGNFRLARRNCDFPPLRLNVKKEPSKGTLFEGQDKLKLVGVCKVDQDYWEQYVLAEYLVYRMFNLFTPISFRVRLARVTYIDNSGEDETFTRYGFIIEDDDVMAARNGGWKVAWEPGSQFNPVLLERDQAILVDVFQYMLGNTDWSGVEMHNMELMQTPPNTPFTVPFDFDISGIVNTRYAEPDASLPITSVRERLFRGFCPDQVNRQPEDYAAVFEEFRQKREEIYGLWRDRPDLDADRLKDTLEYLDDFYKILADPRQIQTRMLDQCRRIGEP